MRNPISMCSGLLERPGALTTGRMTLPRERRQHPAPPDVLRDARQLLAGRLLQAGRGRAGLAAVAGGLRVQGRGHLDHRVRGRQGARARPRRGGDRAWEAVGVPRERIVLCPRSENFWQAGPTGPCGPCSELYLDRGVEFGSPEDLPGGENERFLEYWNLVFMQFNQDPVGTLTPLPNQNIDTGLGLNRMALIQQDAPTIFETDQFAPLMALGSELSPHGEPDDARAAHPGRPLARDDVPHRRRRRAVQRGPRLHPAPRHAPRDPAGPLARHRARLHAALRRASWSTSWAPRTRSSSPSATSSTGG